MLTLSYDEGSIRFREIFFVALEGYEVPGTGGLWSNSFTIVARAPEAEFDVQSTLRDLSRVDAEISKSRSETMAAIRQEEYLALTSQELYVNPKTGEAELGSSEWKQRWVGPSGEVIYSNDKAWDPNLDPALNVSGFERSPVKRR